MALTIARVIMVGQAVASLGVWVGQLQDTFSRMDHNQDVYPQAVLVDILNPLIAVALLAGAIFLGSRPWARALALTMEYVGIISALINVITGFYQAGVAIAVALAVIVLIRRSTGVPRAQPVG
ncbi:hypothetical protein DMH04_55660 [Kibdelosporangium aridum]|uniref:Uncharacterized protein n=1 Tax=Kibdelosporangium aridum TaxID=2030 RepID=A0A428XWH2_KIBAR|nr:hypothetical protein [Kibdelosporangium aridum]RSM59630.1 hypothetical protein DMH04_55660 [Kibdelosporangium aridum]